MDEQPRIIAHRGVARTYPENTLAAFEAAVAAGVDGVELDIQLTADGVPVVLHDPSLQRTTGVDGDVNRLKATDIDALSASEPARFGERFRGEPLPRLNRVAERLSAVPGLRVFIEIKPEVLRHHSAPATVQAVLAASDGLGDQRVIISFRDDVLQATRSQARTAVGWVLPRYGAAAIERARALTPEFLFCDHKLLPASMARLPEGPWAWAVYEVDDASLADRLCQRGVGWLESMCPGELKAAMSRTDGQRDRG
ncbi:glycerophosphodiester phosphodiesterase family protein [Aquisalimonas asiatica]|uniref:Glycerophosphoryl diester phosphodiesterase n=1 Tax=Aquisalimonas asiatica TaxID=406100 RepID=A0A1H8QQC5_9GAMM|nr:glycerophosphodiester phosphodiesterase family protein [Aquisalimonas asiatica]SEO56023.1 glycerophosphoryl diester phosphodiesterase [Aquisalimonas asiatica]